MRGSRGSSQRGTVTFSAAILIRGLRYGAGHNRLAMSKKKHPKLVQSGPGRPTPTLDRATRIDGDPLAGRIGEDKAGLAFGRGVAIVRALHRRLGVEPSAPPLIDAMLGAGRTAARTAAASIRERRADIEADLVRFADFARIGRSLWRLRNSLPFDPVLRKFLSLDDPEFAHDEYLLFIASQLAAVGIVAEPPRHTNATTIDAEVRGAFTSGASLFFEVKERDPRGQRTPTALARYIVRQVSAARGQLGDAGARGIAAVDLGLVEGINTPTEASTLRAITAKLASGPLVGVLISSTAASMEADRAFVPAFRSWLYLSRRVRAGGAEPLEAPLIRQLRRALPYGSWL
jgi:hypothetical protein